MEYSYDSPNYPGHQSFNNINPETQNQYTQKKRNNLKAEYIKNLESSAYSQ